MASRNKKQNEQEAESFQAWDRMPGESTQAYQAFCAYRDAGPTRKMDRVYRQFERQNGRTLPEHRRCASSWWEWSKRFTWRTRAERYDGYLEQLARQKRESDHRRKVEGHLERQREIAVAFQSVAFRMLLVAQAELARVGTERGPSNEPGGHTLIPGRLSDYVRAAAAMAQWGAETEASVLGIDELLGILGEQTHEPQGQSASPD